MGLEVTVAHYRAQSEHFPREVHEIQQTSLNEVVFLLRYTSSSPYPVCAELRPDAMHYMSGHSDSYVFAPQYLHRGPKYNTFAQSLR
jgi:hypothetical protein